MATRRSRRASLVRPSCLVRCCTLIARGVLRAANDSESRSPTSTESAAGSPSAHSAVSVSIRQRLAVPDTHSHYSGSFISCAGTSVASTVLLARDAARARRIVQSDAIWRQMIFVAPFCDSPVPGVGATPRSLDRCPVWPSLGRLDQVAPPNFPLARFSCGFRVDTRTVIYVDDGIAVST
jgi:hypothetical protein